MAWVQEGGALRSREASSPNWPEGLPAAAQGAAMDRAPPPCSPYLAAGPWQDAVRGQQGRAGVRGVEGEVPTDLAPVTQPTLHRRFAPREMRGGRSRVAGVDGSQGRVRLSVCLEQGPRRSGDQC